MKIHITPYVLDAAVMVSALLAEPIDATCNTTIPHDDGNSLEAAGAKKKCSPCNLTWAVRKNNAKGT
ncbi:hypothetical protein BGX24_011878 [Mortierella sp. AD032]|nr:hypothetical protein BGX24_011878 [Mortierella sp. AD032]